MPLSRYQLRNEYGLADPELYRAANKDDPEALLEGVAMAGLVGLLRQLGDLAEFAAEVFHDLHEEVMTTAARGHGLMARVQQLEAEFPSIEKAFLSQTDHSPFFTNAGVDWHPNLRMEQNLITRGDLPRFVMDSYEECRGPPRLFLLDKFDVAGAGACLKRYTDPSFVKVEATSFGIPALDVQREKKIRKVKKKGSRWRNGETPEVPTSHAKLHQLFLEERVENGHPDPARLVKLKRRQLNGFPFDLKPGKSYMEKFLGTSSPEHKVVHEVPVIPSPLKLISDDSNESGLEIVEISTVSPVKKSSEGSESTCSSPKAPEVALKPYRHDLNEDAINREIVMVTDPVAGGEAHESPYVTHKMAIESELAVDEDGKTEASLDGNHSDDLISEVDNYTDALTTMESEMETDNEYKLKTEQCFLKGVKHATDSDAIEENLDIRANFSDSQSFGNSSMSDDGRGSFKQGQSSFSYSDSVSNFAENIPSDSEGAVKISPSSENHAAEIVDSPFDPPSVDVETLGTQSSELLVVHKKCIEEDTIPNTGEETGSLFPSDSNNLLPPSVPVANSIVVETESEEISCDCKLGPKSPNIGENGTGLSDSSIVVSDVPSHAAHNNLPTVSSQGCLVEDSDHEDPNMGLHSSNVADLEKKDSDGFVKEVLQTDYADGINDEIFVAGKIDSPHAVILPSTEQFPCSISPEVDVDLDIALVSESSDIVNPFHIDSEVVDVTAGVNPENVRGIVATLEVGSIMEHQCSDISVDVSQVERELTEVGATHSEETSLEETSAADGGEEIGRCASKLDVGEDSVPFEHPVNFSDKQILDEHVNLKEDVGASPVSVTVTTGADDGVNVANVLSSDLVCSPSSNLSYIQESDTGNEGAHQKGLDFNEGAHQKGLDFNEGAHQKGLDLNKGAFPEYCPESEEQKEVEQMEVAPTDLDSSPYESLSDDHSNLEALKHVHESAVAAHTQRYSYISDDTVPSSELSKLDLESKQHAYLRHSIDISEDAVSAPTSYLSEVETSLEHSLELPADQIFAESVCAVMDEVNFESLDLQSTPPCHLAEPGVPSESTVELQSDQLDEGCLQADKTSPKSSNLQFEEIQTVSEIDKKRCLGASSKQDAPSGQELQMQPAGPELNDAMLSRNPFDSVFPSFGILPENLEEVPPLPPLPPMQWRLGKVQPAPPASHKEWIDHGEGTLLPIQPFAADEKSQFDFLSSESVENSLQPTPLSLEMPTVISNANSQLVCHPLEGGQSLNPFLTLPEIINGRPEDGFLASGGRPIRSSPNLLSPLATVEHIPTEHDPVPSHGLEIKPSSQLTPESILEAKEPEHSLQNSEEKRDSHDKSISTPTMLEDHPQQDSLTLHGETTWAPSSLALPPIFEVGKPNGSKLPRPRNPLIDAVAAHDKSKLRKVTERVRPQITPKLDERDLLLEQIRTKSFNLKPAAVMRPSIQGIQDTKTNLKVAAILEKANAIRQALAGSDEDDDTDSWSE
ncbi:protein SCAR2 isoform X2 [Hevea brasiliensis]|uniref:protein SCAR2 isoform X2 n=1 Tax=Hevea brasiliensis TaxID=3981 RepID=UPI0025FC93CC|nr:protein SCAR2 isoform X2 [Hevea brasiliensis]